MMSQDGDWTLSWSQTLLVWGSGEPGRALAGSLEDSSGGGWPRRQELEHRGLKRDLGPQ